MRMIRSIRCFAVPLVAVAVVAGCNDALRNPVSSEQTPEGRAQSNNALPTLLAAPSGSFSRMQAASIPLSPQVVGAMFDMGGAPPGTLVRSIAGANPTNCGIQTGIAFDGTNLIMSCWYNQTLDLLSPADGHLVKQLAIPSTSGGINAMAWDGKLNRLWACMGGQEVYVIDTSDPDGDGVVAAAEVQHRFTATDQCHDGFAFDGADRTIWTSGDVHSNVFHYTETGIPLGNYYVAGILGTGNSGIAAGGGNLYLANNGNSQIYVTNKPPTHGTLFATFPRRIEDMECDDITFRADGIAAIWQQDAYDRDIQAYAIEPGACPFGGFIVPQAVMDVRPGTISLTSTPVVNAVLISNALFDATAINLSNTVFVIDGNEAGGVPVAKRGATFLSSVADFNHDSRMDRLVTFNMSALRGAGLTTHTTDIRVQDVTSATGKFQASDTVQPTFVP